MNLMDNYFLKGWVLWCVFGSLAGFRPTGRLHLGHYFSVIKPGLDGCDVLVANYHAPEEKNLEDSANLLRRFGVKNIKIQKDIFNPELYFRLLLLAKMGDLNRMTQYKATHPEDRTSHLLTYPVLMAHDVANYAEVFVGEDQTQHLEYARKLLKKYNSEFGADGLVGIPTAKINGGRIKDLRHPSKKMSKSAPDGCLFLDDTPDEIHKKIKRATMTPEGVNNLGLLYNEFVGNDIPLTNKELKDKLTVALIELTNIPRFAILSELTDLSQEMGLY